MRKDGVVIGSIFSLKRLRVMRNASFNTCFSSSHLFTDSNFLKMHKIALCTLFVFAVVAAAPQQAQDQNQVHILKQDSEVTADGYQFDFQTSDGTARQEKATLKQLDADHQALEVSGSYQYVGTDGLTYTVTFTADENGYQPQEHVAQQ